MSQLTIYRASAGSGKTFTLTIEYIKHLLSNPASYRSILAVTFTNKATEEMKMRILSQLYGLAAGLSSSDQYLSKIKTDTGFTTEHIRTRAREALYLLLHNYHYFRVETIDTFFQSIFRNLARELDLTPNLRIDLNDEAVKNEAVDELIRLSGKSGSLRRLLMKFILDSIHDDKGWDVTEDIKKFGSIIFKDFYKEHNDAINASISKLGDFEKRLRAIIERFEEDMIAFANHHEATKEKEHRYIDSYFKKLRNKKFSSKDLLNQTTAKYPEVFAKAEGYRLAHIREYNTAKAVLPHLNQLALLHDIEQKVYDLNSESNRFLLSDTQNILYKMIHSAGAADSDNAPFIYEKIGSRLSDIMIDEFQDTSVIQWENLKLLVDDCISQENNSALIVGDVKQSIYRWRAGDWRLLNNMEKTYDSDMVKATSLDVNYRSEKNIVCFNNMFFEKAVDYYFGILKESSEQYAELLKKAYEDVKQKTKKTDDNGYVCIEFLNTENDYQQQQLEKIYETIMRLKSCGVKEKDIALLLRWNRHITLIANYFAQHHPDIRIISDEAFKLSSSGAVLIMVEAMRNLVQDDDISLAHLVKLYRYTVMHEEIDETKLFLHHEEIHNYLPEEYTAGKEKLLALPLYELAERLYAIFHLKDLAEESGFVCAFFDYLLNYVMTSSAEKKDFLKEWDKHMCSKSIQSDDADGVRIMSIHKSKGLEFKNVILPFFDWELEHECLIWADTKDKGVFSMMPLLPVVYKQDLKESLFCDIYAEEFMQNIVDNLNAIYVAFTRAEQNLFVFTRNKKNNQPTVFDVVDAVAGGLKKTDGNEANPEKSWVYEYGSLYAPEESTVSADDDKVTNKLISKQDQTICIDIETYDNPAEFRQSNKSNYLFSPEEIEENREKGTLLHNIFSEIEYEVDASSVVDRYEEKGFFNDSVLSRQEAEDALKKAFNNEQMHDWFSKRWLVCNERDILLRGGDGKTVKFRCDRVVFSDNDTVVIDFKFGKPRLEYEHQVKNYIKQLTDVGFKNVSGYLWYANDEKLVEVR